MPSEAADADYRTGSPTRTGQDCPEPPDSSVRLTAHITSSDPQRSASLTLAHDESRADEDDEDDLAESIREYLEAWSLRHYGVHLDLSDEQYIVGMVARGVQRRAIENTIKKRIREAAEDWRAFMPVELAEASGAPF